MQIRRQRSKIAQWAAAIIGLLVTTCVPSQHWDDLASVSGNAASTAAQPTAVLPTRLSRPGTAVPTATSLPVLGELRLAVREDIKTLNPYRLTNDSEAFVVSLVYDTLLSSDSEGQLAPGLAERWDLTPDGVNLTFWLNPQARWHHGQPVTAADVLFSFEFVREQQFPGLARLMALVDRVEALSPDEVKFTLLGRQADAARLLGTQWVILPSVVWENVDDPLIYTNLDNPIGSGPYAFEQFVAEERVVLRNTAAHYQTQPRAATIVVTILRDEDRALQALRDGELDAIGWDVEPALARRVLDNPEEYAGIRVAEAPGVETWTLLLNLRRAPYDSPAIRQALAQGVDREAIIEAVLNGFGDVAAPGLFPTASVWRNKDIEPIPFDPQAAVAQLEFAGFDDVDGDGLREKTDGSALRMPIACVELPVPLQVAERVAADLRALGLSSEVTAIPQDEWIPTLMQAQFDVALYSIPVNGPEMLFFYLHSSRGTRNGDHTSGLNYGGYANPQFDEMASASLQELDPLQRQELVYRMQEILAVDLPHIPLYCPRMLNLFRTERFTRWQMQPGSGLLNRATVGDLVPVRVQ
jgi:peptide/nickel transport system substrate-binding protein